MLCILYVITISTWLGVVALLTERALPPAAPRRWVWFAAIALSVIIPPIYRSQHAAAVSAGNAAADPSWWVRIGTYDAAVMRLWLVASVGLVVWGLFNAWRISRLIRQSRDSGTGRPEVLDGVPVIVTDVAGPATIGVLRSRVLVPRWVLALPRTHRQYVLRHEEEHRRANDARLLFFASLTLVLTPWNLALWWKLRRLSLAVELDCDRRVVAALGDAPAYGELLLRVAEAANRGPRLQPGFIGSGMLERRLTMLLAPAQLSRAMRYALPALAVALLFVILSTPHPVVGSHAVAHTSHTAEP